ncbi:hypothetical protein MC45_01915 [Sphingomonas taxi]|uniref:PIN domain-containing protein n=1 Tax=Sphingomonas taxi TaxID=1549858 RepID=A0A097ECS7_9SPHN|nr:PIN domain-containing protein [Sphingomonas taxi]AIT05366.1 hypothetical protein MC45_01915 [Sphingomonas taxi]
MSAGFLDTNVLLYGFTADDHRQPEAMRLIRAGCVISVQCLNECAFVARRKLRMTWAEIADPLAIIVQLSRPVMPVTIDLHRLGIHLAERYTLSVYDGMIAAAAVIAGCDILYSEDMHHGLFIDGRVRIVNPFAPA